MIQSEDNGVGEIRIADEVVATIAGLSATEVEGVSSMAGNLTKDLIGRLGVKNLSKGVKIAVDGQDVTVDLALNIAYGYNIVEVSSKVQEKVKGAIENMIGLKAPTVNVHIVSVDMASDK